MDAPFQIQIMDKKRKTMSKEREITGFSSSDGNVMVWVVLDIQRIIFIDYQSIRETIINK